MTFPNLHSPAAQCSAKPAVPWARTPLATALLVSLVVLSMPVPEVPATGARTMGGHLTLTTSAEAAPQPRPQPQSRARSRERGHFERGPVIENFDPKKVEVGYRNVLGELASGDLDDAVDHLMDLEMRYVSPRLGLKELFKAEGALLKPLVQSQPELLLPIIMMHHEASTRYRDRRIWFLSNHSREVARVLTERYAASAQGQGSQIIASRALTSLGGLLQEYMTSTFCRCTELYDKALSLDESNQAALLGMGTVMEKTGDYVEAMRYFGDLVKHHPKNLEGHLRYAINLERVRGSRDGAEALRQITHETGDSWPIVLAYQELIRIRIDDENYQAAEPLLQEARTRFPSDQRLALQQSLLYERTRRSAESNRVLAEIEGTSRRAAPSPRLLYNRWPDELMRELRADLRQHAENRLEPLREYLADR